MKSIPNTSSRIDEVRRLKQEGLSMTEIIHRLGGGAGGTGSAASRPASARAVAIPQAAPLHLTLDDIGHPAYMLNQNFELMWINPAGRHVLFQDHLELPQTSEQRNLFRLLPVGHSE